MIKSIGTFTATILVMSAMALSTSPAVASASSAPIVAAPSAATFGTKSSSSVRLSLDKLVAFPRAEAPDYTALQLRQPEFPLLSLQSSGGWATRPRLETFGEFDAVYASTLRVRNQRAPSWFAESVAAVSVSAPVAWRPLEIATVGNDLPKIGLHKSEAVKRVKSYMEADVPHVSTEQIASLIGSVEDLIREKKFNDIDSLFAEVVPEKCPSAFLVAPLRISYPVRNKISGWGAFRELVRVELASRALDSDKILRGL